MVVLSGQKDSKKILWEKDIEFLVKIIKEKHPNPFYRTSESEFIAQAEELKSQLDGLTDHQVVVKLMKLVASLKDGHSSIYPGGSKKILFDRWFPIRFYKFSDGIYITAADKRYSHLVGAKIIKINNVEINSALKVSAELIASDNNFGAEEWSSFYLINAYFLKALKINDKLESLILSVQIKNKRKKVKIFSIRSKFKMSWYKSLLKGPPGGEYVDAFPDRSRIPFHLQNINLLNYWFTHLKDKKTIYMQLNEIFNHRGETFAFFHQRLFKYIEENKADVEKLIVDLRYNSGGNGHMLLPFIHGLIKCEHINQKGRLYTITGPRTFSAAVIAVGDMKRHTQSIFVGKPPGAPLNFYSDYKPYTLPNSKVELDISTLFFQLSVPANKDLVYYPDIPMSISSVEFFSGKDPSLESILSGLARPVTEICLKEGSDKAFLHYKKLEKTFGSVGKWKKPSETEINSYGYSLLEIGKMSEGESVFELNTMIYPTSWNTWDSLGEFYYLRKRNYLKALQFYNKSLLLNPGRSQTKKIIKKLKLYTQK